MEGFLSLICVLELIVIIGLLVIRRRQSPSSRLQVMVAILEAARSWEAWGIAVQQRIHLIDEAIRLAQMDIPQTKTL